MSEPHGCDDLSAARLLAGRILKKETAQAAFGLEIPDERERRLRHLFLRDMDSFARDIRGRQDPNLLALALYLRWLPDTFRRYAEQGIPEYVFFDTFQDFAIWSEQCLRTTGRPGLLEWEWNALSLRMEIFRLGRLQFQPGALQKAARLPQEALAAGTPVLEVHIPAGGSLRKPELLASFCAAVPFFEKYFHYAPSWFTCHSWLLAPQLGALLPPESGILQFQSLFTVYEEDYTYPQAEERVFGAVAEDPRDYPEHTLLQRALKRYLLEGGRVGMGLGVINRAKLTPGGYDNAPANN